MQLAQPGTKEAATSQEEDVMSRRDDQRKDVPPGEQQGGTPIGDGEAREKGPWAAQAAEGIVPGELGADAEAPDDEQPDLGGSVVGSTTGSDTPATEQGVDLEGGRNADATTDGGPAPSNSGEPDLKDAAAGPRQVDLKAAE